MFKYKQLHQLSMRSLKRRHGQNQFVPVEANSSHCPEINDVQFDLVDINDSVDLNTESDKYSVLSDVSFEDSQSINETILLKNVLIDWSQQYEIKHNALTVLMKFLQSTKYPDLPKDARTLLKTPKSRESIPIGTKGHYVHIGAKQAIHRILNESSETREIDLDLNIDGSSSVA